MWHCENFHGEICLVLSFSRWEHSFIRTMCVRLTVNRQNKISDSFSISKIYYNHFFACTETDTDERNRKEYISPYCEKSECWKINKIEVQGFTAVYFSRLLTSPPSCAGIHFSNERIFEVKPLAITAAGGGAVSIPQCTVMHAHTIWIRWIENRYEIISTALRNSSPYQLQCNLNVYRYWR